VRQRGRCRAGSRRTDQRPPGKARRCPLAHDQRILPRIGLTRSPAYRRGSAATRPRRPCSFSIEGSRSGAANDPPLALPFPGSTMEHPGAASGVSVPSARDACALIRRPRGGMNGRNEPKTLDGAAQLVRTHVGVALRAVRPTSNRSVREHVAPVVLPSGC
jgi:hypothetical protein